VGREDRPLPEQARGPRQFAVEIGRNLASGGLDYALTGAAAIIIAPFVTAVPVTEVWVPARNGA
jgi:hypothetical protein